MNKTDTVGLKLTKAQREMLIYYADHGPTAQSNARGTLNTWRSLLRRGFLIHSGGLGTIETEITDLGRIALGDQP